MTFETRRLQPDDWRQWREIRLRTLVEEPDAFGGYLEREQGFAEADWRQRLADPTVVIFAGDRPVACGGPYANRPGYAAIVAMWVDPEFRGRGLSHRVLDQLVHWANEQDLSVELGVNRINRIARTAYERYGFVATGHSHPLREGSDQVIDVLELRRG